MSVNFSLRVKLLFLVLSVVVCFGVTIGFYATTRVAGDLTAELLKRGVSAARHIAESSAETFIENDHVQLHYLARNHQQAEPDIRYVLMINRSGELLGHSFGTTFPLELAMVNRYRNDGEPSVRRLDTGSGIIYDIAVPVLDGRIGGVRIGMSADPISTVVNELIRELLVAITLIGILAFAVTLPAAQAIARPLSRLTRAIESLTKGRRDLRLPVDRRDEIGVLNDAFNQMATDVRTAEKRLAAQVNFLQVLMDDLPVPVFYKDRHLQMLGCNSAFAEFWGKSADRIIGCAPEALYPPEEASLHRAKDEAVLREGQPLTYELAVVGATGEQRDIIFHKALFRDEDGQPAGIIGAMQDVTLQRKADRSKSDFVSTVAHEFQTPLATILGFSELLQEGVLGEAERKEALQLIIRKAEMLSRMVSELLDLARLESDRQLSVNREPCNLNDLLGESIAGFRIRIATHRFSLDLPSPPLMVDADRQRIAQVQENLLSNAVKYSGAASTIYVSACRAGDRCRISVRDEGIGMSPDQVEHLFDKFYRADSTKSAPSGTGLGLFITRAIIEAHQGEIRIDSALGLGTTVTVELPLANP